jgi:uncharacterized protein (DUF2267 family)
MKADQFIKEVMNRASLPSRQQAIEATHATLSVLGERLFGGERKDLAAQLPPELQIYLLETQVSRSFGLEEFFERISEEEGTGVEEASAHARAVIDQRRGGNEFTREKEGQPSGWWERSKVLTAHRAGIHCPEVAEM